MAPELVDLTGPMSHRTFRDEIGREWDVWEVVPTAVERRIANAITVDPKYERRKIRQTRVVVPDGLQRGWLAFQWDSERRRLAPIPENWDELTNSELIELLHRANQRSRPRRLVE